MEVTINYAAEIMPITVSILYTLNAGIANSFFSAISKISFKVTNILNASVIYSAAARTNSSKLKTVKSAGHTLFRRVYSLTLAVTMVL